MQSQGILGGRVRGYGYSIWPAEDWGLSRLPGNLDEAEHYGAGFVELSLFHMDIIANGKVQAGPLKRLKSMLAKHTFGVTVHGPMFINFMDAKERLPAHEQVMRASLEVSAELGAVYYVVHAGKMPAGRMGEIDWAYARQRDALNRMGDVARAAGIVITVENVFPTAKGMVTPLPSELASELAAIGHANVQACFDFSHGFINATTRGRDFWREAVALAPYARHMHIHDSFGHPETFEKMTRGERLAYGIGDLHLPIGWGTLPWDEMMQKLNFPRGAILNLELAPPYWTELADSLKRVQQMAATLGKRP